MKKKTPPEDLELKRLEREQRKINNKIYKQRVAVAKEKADKLIGRCFICYHDDYVLDDYCWREYIKVTGFDGESIIVTEFTLGSGGISFRTGRTYNPVILLPKSAEHIGNEYEPITPSRYKRALKTLKSFIDRNE